MNISETNSDDRLFYPATSRNRNAILNVLKEYLPKVGTALEIASGSGQHITYFADKMKSLKWQPSEYDVLLQPSIIAWIKACNLQKIVKSPLIIDTRMEKWPIDQITDLSSILAINLIHIAPFTVCESLFKNAANHLIKNGVLYLYGPYKINSQHTAKSNEYFDRTLKLENPKWGVRDIERVEKLGRKFDFNMIKTLQMPANNQSLIFKKK